MRCAGLRSAPMSRFSAALRRSRRRTRSQAAAGSTLSPRGASTSSWSAMKTAAEHPVHDRILLINDREVALGRDDGATLLDTIRAQPGLTGTKLGCGRGECGACTVLVGTRAVLSCLTLAAEVGEPVTTIEGLAADDLRAAFADFGGFQCGFCTPGQLAACEALLRAGGELTEPAARHALAGNICRCTGYTPIIDALLSVARRR